MKKILQRDLIVLIFIKVNEPLWASRSAHISLLICVAIVNTTMKLLLYVHKKLHLNAKNAGFPHSNPGI
jgi:hypothetical protein